MKFENLIINKIQLETSDTITVFFEIPEHLKNNFTFLPGQYLTLKATINGEEIRRAYSISTAPFEKNIGVTIKRVPGGRLSTYIHSNWKSGDTVMVAGPEGNFTVEANHDKKRKFCFIAAGSGITPIMAMVKTILEEEPTSVCYLLYGSRSEDNIIFREQLNSLEQKYTGQIQVNHTLSKPISEKAKGLGGLFKKPKISWLGETGRISKEKISAFLDKNTMLNNNGVLYYLCGPGDMIQHAENVLEKRGISKDKIYKEFFSTPDSDKTSVTGSAATIKVHLNNETFEMHISGKKPILDELIDLKKNPPYSCTSGACSSCMAKVIEGKVKMEVCYALDEADIEKGLILTCQAKPVTERVEISYDV